MPGPTAHRSSRLNEARDVLRIRPGELSVFARAVRFAFAGGVVAGVYLLVTLLLSRAAGLPFQLALVLGFATALMTHFTLQRFFVWAHHEEFALPLQAQAGRYLAISLTQYGVTAAVTATVPNALHVSTDLVYVAVTAIITVVNFTLFRTRVFHPDSKAASATADADL